MNRIAGQQEVYPFVFNVVATEGGQSQIRGNEVKSDD